MCNRTASAASLPVVLPLIVVGVSGEEYREWSDLAAHAGSYGHPSPELRSMNNGDAADPHDLSEAEPMGRRHFLATASALALGITLAAATRASGREVMVIGVGGAGIKIARGVWQTGLEAQYCTLDRSGRPDPRILGAMRVSLNTQRGSFDAALRIDDILNLLPSPIHCAAVIGGLGGTTASQVLPALMGALSARGICAGAYCTLPFGFEGAPRQRSAERSLTAIRATGALPRIARNQDLLRGAAGRSLGEILRVGDARLVREIRRFLLTR